MKKNNLVIGFDLDGVIVNSLSVMEKSWTELSKKNNIRIPFSSYKKNIGLKFNVILKNIGLDKNLNDIVHKEYFEGTKKYQNEVKLYPFVIETFEELKKRSISTFIVTSKPRRNTVLLLNMFNINIDLLVCADDITNGKPNKESGDIVYNKFGKKDILYVGDMESDRQFAENCNFKFIYAAYGYGSMSKDVQIKIINFKQILDISSAIYKA